MRVGEFNQKVKNTTSVIRKNYSVIPIRTRSEKEKGVLWMIRRKLKSIILAFVIYVPQIVLTNHNMATDIWPDRHDVT